MKKVLINTIASLAIFGSFANIANANELSLRQEPLCEVKVCNKLERFTLDVWKHIKDSMGEQCFTIVMPKSEAVVGKVLSSESRWYQGSFNPTKKSVTKVKEVYRCEE